MTELQKKMVEKLGLSQEDFQPKKAKRLMSWKHRCYTLH